ncbi:MAG: hypothetical protein MJ175_04710 [Clostridia bacterium]|nr:hypothetical protein [Clostridia bacterium]
MNYNGKFFCGAGREIITPPIGTLLYGYRPDVVSTALHDDLTVTCVCVGNGTDTALLVSLTLGDICTAMTDELRTVCSDATGIPFENILLAPTHTHSGPNTSGVEGWGPIDRNYVDGILIPATKKAANDAFTSMAEAEMAVVVGDSDVGVNRRVQFPDGHVDFGQNPWGYYEPQMTIMICRRADDKRGISNLVHYGCQGTAAGCTTEISRDWSGMMIDRMEKLTATMTVFFNGAMGDVGPRITNGLTTGDITYVEELGGKAASDAMRIYNSPKTYFTPDVKLFKGDVHLPYQELPDMATVKARLARFKGDPEKLVNIDRFEYVHYKAIEELIEKGETELPEPFTFQQTLVSVGNTLFIPFPYEQFSQISARLRAYSGYEHTLTLSCCNGYNAYLPSEDQLCRGGYEVGMFRYSTTHSLADNTDQHIIDENMRILREGQKAD